METMFDTLLQLPLFQGLAQEDFTRILEKVKLHFTKYKPGELLLKEGGACHELVFVLKGEIASSTSSADSSYCFTEYFPAPFLIGHENALCFYISGKNRSAYGQHQQSICSERALQLRNIPLELHEYHQ